MRNRNRWIGDEDLRTEVADIGRKHLEEWNVGESTVVALARAQVVEVLEDKPNPASHKPVARVNEAPGNKPKQTIHKPLWAWLTLGISKVLGSSRWISNAMQREMRRMPWESLLTMAARKYQNHEELLVYRRLGGLGDRKDTFATTQPLKALFIESAPGVLWNVYDFDMELRAVETYLKEVRVSRQQNLSLPELKKYVEQNQPVSIHVSGIDGYQGFSILQERADTAAKPDSEATPNLNPEPAKQPSRPQEGVYFRDESGQPKVETPEAVAAALCAGAKKPLLVTFNLYNSSARLAAETVKHGAAAAIGFQDFIDDTVAEIFFANLFRAWSQKSRTPLLEAFRVAVQDLHPYLDRVRGSGVTLWTSEPLLEDPDAICLPQPRKRRRRSNEIQYQSRNRRCLGAQARAGHGGAHHDSSHARKIRYPKGPPRRCFS